MRTTQAVAVSLVVMSLLVACGKKPAEPAPSAALARPLLALESRSGRILIPQAALVTRGGIPGVFVLTEQGEARFRMVRTGKSDAGRVEILSGLKGDETLVTGDLGAVHDGSRIEKP